MLVSELFEGRMDRLHGGSWAILPAARILFGKNKVTIKDMSSEWKKGTVYVVDLGGKRNVFIYSSGNISSIKKGETYRAHHDQTFADLGSAKVLNIIPYHVEDDKVKMDTDNELGTKDAFPLYVFK